MKTHNLKIWPEFYAAVVLGLKRCEVRFNDRDYKYGDHLILHEWCPEAKWYTGAIVEVIITHILSEEVPGLCLGYVCLSIEKV
jgi:hypothetical protein